jgi:endonuclease YncB( thermonuclease family)
LLSLLLPNAQAEETQTAGWRSLEDCQLADAAPGSGDNFLVQHGREASLFRLYWVDCPESSENDATRLRKQARYFSISEEDVMQSGKTARRFARKFLRGSFTVHTRWQDARADPQTSYYAIIEKDGEYLSEALVAEGLARIYGMPTDEPWPEGPAPRTYLGRLKHSERQAQRDGAGIWGLAGDSMQISGLEALLAASEGDSAPLGPARDESQTIAPADKINLNEAPLEALDTLHGIGPALGRRIIAARPIESVDALVAIPGISANTLAEFRHMVVTEDPPPPPKTVAFYMAELDRYLDEEVVVVVDEVDALDVKSPDGFRALKLKTAFEGESGGAITTFIPAEFYNSFRQFYAEPGKEFTGLLYRQNGEVVLVYRRK